MHKINEYIGKKYGMLICQEYLYTKRKVYPYFRFKCDCGNSCEKALRDITRKDRKTKRMLDPNCGCLKKLNLTNWEEKTGQIINGLTVLKYLGKQHSNPLFRYKCHCGNERDTTWQNLLRTTSCGCQNSDVRIGCIFQNFKVLEIEKKRCKVECIKCNKTRKMTFNSLHSKTTDNCVCNTGYREKNNEMAEELRLYRRFINTTKFKRGTEVYLNFNTWLNFVTKKCKYCKRTPEELGKKVNGLDRIDSKGNYTLDNVNPCCYDCNVAKSDLTLDYFKQHVKRIYDVFFNDNRQDLDDQYEYTEE